MLNTPEGDPTVEKHPRRLHYQTRYQTTQNNDDFKYSAPTNQLISVVYAFFFIFFFFFLEIAFMGIVSPLELKAKSNTHG